LRRELPWRRARARALCSSYLSRSRSWPRWTNCISISFLVARWTFATGWRTRSERPWGSCLLCDGADERSQRR